MNDKMNIPSNQEVYRNSNGVLASCTNL